MNKMFDKILIANRGEIAVRVIRACRELGITSAAIYSDADRKTLHTRLADEAYYIGSPVASESYLNMEKIIATAKKIGASAIHPGYGFFSENSKFIKMVEDAEITFIGPSSKSVEMMGSKTAARELMVKNNVPVVPGTTKAIQSLEEGKRMAKQIGYPILLKAAAGGGGKGMRQIFSEKEFESAFEATRREALKAFGDDAIYIEKFIINPRHIEVQIIADKDGNYVHLNERECSVQRRHQKVVEESPSSFVDPETRQKITEAALNAAKACGYYNAGTVECLMNKDKEFYFLEMNTRVQVEHPVTELVTGIDIVKEQISIACGNKLSFNQDDIGINGHAVECRIYAEDSSNNFLPSTGEIYDYSEPSGPGIRVDSGFSKGSEITVYYDPLIAKIISWAKDRNSAITKVLNSLNEFQIAGVVTNIPFLQKILMNENFRKGNYNINFLQEEIFSKDGAGLTDSKDLENAAAMMAAILKSNIKIEGNGKKNERAANQNNQWASQNYE
jgi:acetyl-CoA carboxylase, biotin carboxylase subunit